MLTVKVVDYVNCTAFPAVSLTNSALLFTSENVNPVSRPVFVGSRLFAFFRLQNIA